MKDRLGLLVGIAVLAGALSACSKPASDTAEDAGATASDTAAATSTAATDAGSGAMDAGGAVSPPSSPQNDPINTDTNKGEATQTPGSSSFTEAQARGHIENAGYTSVSGLTKTPEGMWTGSAQKGGKTMQVSVDFKGAVSAK